MFYVTKFKTDLDDNTMSFPALSARAPNADHDGDARVYGVVKHFELRENREAC